MRRARSAPRRAPRRSRRCARRAQRQHAVRASTRSRRRATSSSVALARDRRSSASARATATTNQLDDRSIDERRRAARCGWRGSRPRTPRRCRRSASRTTPRAEGAVDPATAKLTPRRAREGGRRGARRRRDRQGRDRRLLRARQLQPARSRTSAGLSAYHAWTSCGLSCTARTTDGTGSGWAGAAVERRSPTSTPRALAKTAVDKAIASAEAAAGSSPASYTVVLEPAAVASCSAFLTGSLGRARAPTRAARSSAKPAAAPGRRQAVPRHRHAAQRPDRRRARRRAVRRRGLPARARRRGSTSGTLTRPAPTPLLGRQKQGASRRPARAGARLDARRRQGDARRADQGRASAAC